MADVLVMLALSPTMDEGQVVKLLKSEGDDVSSGDVVAEVETDKATMELESFLDGTLLKWVVNEGDTVSVGAPIAVIGEEGDDVDEALDDFGGGGAGESDAVVPMSSGSNTNAGDDSGGGSTNAGDDSGGASTNAGDDSGGASTNAGDDSEGGSKSDSRSKNDARTRPSGRGDGRIIASPLARKMAEDAGIDLAQVDGSGPGGRIIKRDIESARTQPRPSAAPVGEPYTGPWAEDVEPEPLSNVRKTIARRLTQSWVTAPHFFLELAINMDRAYAVRKELNNALAAADGGKISFNDLIVKACALALQENPDVNAAFSDDGMRHFDGSHIGVAVAIPEGLVVPVIRNAEDKTLRTISAETRDLASRARDKKLKPEEMTGSTFSVSNLGMYGIDRFTAVLNPPEACILAVGAMKKEPVVDADDKVSVSRIMRVTMSCDHRAVDGATGAEFLQVLKTYLENPLLLMA